MAGQQGQPKYGFGWPDGRLGGLGPAGSTTPASLLNMCFNIEYSCHTITNIKHGWRLSLQLMTN